MRVRFCMDSGAYSLYTTRAVGYGDNGKHIKGVKSRLVRDYSYYDSPEFEEYVHEYIQYVKFFGKAFDFFVMVDVIFDPERTVRTLKWFDDAGVVPMPVYHFGVDFSYFKKYVDKYPYVGLGGVPMDTTLVNYIQHGNRIFNYLGKTRDVKTHGFALTAFQLLTLWPWTSVDSTSPSVHGRFGNIMLPAMSRNKGKLVLDYSGINNILTVSTVRGTHKDHVGLKGAALRGWTEEYLESLGTSLVEVCNSHLARDVVNYVWIDRFLKTYQDTWGHAAPRFWKSGKYSSAPTKVPWLITRMADNGVDELNYMGTFYRLDGMRVVNKLLPKPVFMTNRQLKKALANGRAPLYQSVAPRFRLVEQRGLSANYDPLLLPGGSRPRLRRDDGNPGRVRDQLRLRGQG